MTGCIKRWWGDILKSYATEVKGDHEALNNNGGMLTGDGEALKGDAWRFKVEEKALKGNREVLNVAGETPKATKRR